VTQYAYPTSDVENSGGWTTEPLWSKVDEEPYSDADYVQALQNAVNLAFTVALGSPNDPNVHTGHTLRIRAKCNVARAFKFELLQTSTVIHDSGSTNLTTSFAEYSFTLTEGEAANITNYAALRVRVTAITTYAGEYEQVSWMRLEVPDVVAIDLVPTEGYQTQASDSPVLTQEHHLAADEGVQVQVSDSPVLSIVVRGEISFQDLIELPEAKRLVICEHKPAIEVELKTWAAGAGANSYYTSMTDREIIEVQEDGAAYGEVFTAAECEADDSTFFMDLVNQRLYLHTSNGDIPSHQTSGVYDFCILAYFIIGFADRVDADGRDPVFEPEIEMLLDGGFEDWTSETVPAHWTEA